MTEMSPLPRFRDNNIDEVRAPAASLSLTLKISGDFKSDHKLNASFGSDSVELSLGKLSAYSSVNHAFIKLLLQDLESEAKLLGSRELVELLKSFALRSNPLQEILSCFVSPRRPEFEEIKDASTIGNIPAITLCYRGRIGARAIVSIAKGGETRGRIDTFDSNGKHLYSGVLFGNSTIECMAMLQEVHLFIASSGGFPGSKEDMKGLHLKTIHLPLNPKGDADEFARKHLEGGIEQPKSGRKRLLGLF